MGNHGNSFISFGGIKTFDITNIKLVDQFPIVIDIDGQGIAFNNDGSKMYAAGISNAGVSQFDLSTPFSVSTVTSSGIVGISEDSTPEGMAFNNDGSKMFVAGRSNKRVYEYDLSVPFSVGTRVFFARSIVIPNFGNLWGVQFNNDGSKMFVAGSATSRIVEFDLVIPFDVLSASALLSQEFVVSQDISVRDLVFNDTGSKMFVIGISNDRIYQYTLTTPFDIGTASFSTQSDILFDDNSGQGIAWNNDGSKLYIMGRQNNTIFEYDVC